jgi:hypothetical protein
MMKDWKIDNRTANIQNGAVRSKISSGMNISRDIRMVIPVRGVRIRMLFKPLAGKIGVYLPI